MLLKRVRWRPPRVNNAEALLPLSHRHILPHQPHNTITTQIAQRINHEIDSLRREKQLKHIIEQRRDWMSYLVLQIRFKKNTTMVTLRSYDRVLFAVMSRIFSDFSDFDGH